MIRHIVIFKWKPEAPADRRAKLEAMIKALPNQIDFIRRFEIGYDVLHGPRSSDFGIIVDFDDMAALKAYATHPAHLPVVDMVNELCERAVVDYEIGR